MKAEEVLITGRILLFGMRKSNSDASGINAKIVLMSVGFFSNIVGEQLIKAEGIVNILIPFTSIISDVFGKGDFISNNAVLCKRGMFLFGAFGLRIIN